MANKLPNFGTNASPDKTVVDGTATVIDSGFQVNTVIAASEVNTYFKSLMTGLKGLIDTIDMSTLTWQASDTSATWKSNFSAALKNYVVNTQVTEATKLSSNAGDATHPIYFSNGKPAKCNDTIASNISGNAATATKLADARTISISGDAEGRTGFSGASDSNISLTVNKAATADSATKLSTSAGSAYKPVYFKDGIPVVTTMGNANEQATLTAGTNCMTMTALSDKTAFIALVTLIDHTAAQYTPPIFWRGIVLFENGVPSDDVGFVSNYNSASLSPTYVYFDTTKDYYGTSTCDVYIWSVNSSTSARTYKTNFRMFVRKLFEI